ncbi:MAG: MotA/TolQ/ExbB proton channel family protein [Planctomycetales bacterium]|nr:MotA/TolQ/ExbB proton channel family protein [Planctomycetales bacterium]
MNNAIRNRRLVAGSPLSLAILLFGAAGLCLVIGDMSWSQDDPSPILVEDVLANDTDVSPDQTAQLSLLSLIIKGGYLMIPLGVMSILVVVVVVERYLALRTNRVLPKALLEGIANLNAVPGAMDPRRTYRLCQQYPSAAATVVQSMLLRIGRPQSEIQAVVNESLQREASRLHGGVRWLNLAAAVSPLMGLFGTVWGMIQAFFLTTQLEAGQNKADFLAEGIYVALVTTLAGLTIAIPAAIFAHYFEGKIQTQFHRIEELLFQLLPQVERYEGRMRVSAQTLWDDSVDGESESADPAPRKSRRQNAPLES